MSKFISTTILLSIISLPVFARNHYVAFVDAGSSGSRVHVFQYDNAQNMLVINDVFSESIKPGLSAFVDQPELAGASLKTILDDATQYLKQQEIDPHAITINVLATAGMRLLPEDKQQAIFTNVKQYISNNYRFVLGDIKTITGKMESLYGWLDVNYLLGNFQHHQPTMGSIDMGGASTEIAFATDDKSKPEDETTLTINGQQYTVFSKSFLGLGQDQIRATMSADLQASSCFPSGYAYSSTGIGNFNMAACGTIYAGILAQGQITTQLITIPNQTFIAYSGIYFTYDFFNNAQTPSDRLLESEIQNICNQSWSDLQKSYPQISIKYLYKYCADGAYEDQLIYHLYKMQNLPLVVTNQIHQKDIDWTAGAVLYSLL